jgi:hypothetical protein
MMRRLRFFPVEDLILTQFIPGFFFAMVWTAMYEIYHEDGSYYTTLLQEIVGEEGLFPYFLISAVLMAFPIGMVVDSVRYVVGEMWLGLPRIHPGRRATASSLGGIERLSMLPEGFERRYILYHHARATLLTPAKAAGNMALILLVLTIWSLVKIVRMGGWHVFSAVFVIGTPLVGLGLVLGLLIRYARGLAEFHGQVQESIFPPKETGLPPAADDASPSLR